MEVRGRSWLCGEEGKSLAGEREGGEGGGHIKPSAKSAISEATATLLWPDKDETCLLFFLEILLGGILPFFGNEKVESETFDWQTEGVSCVIVER